MAAYGNQDEVRAGTLDGLEHDFISRLSAVTLQFGDPVMLDTGDEDKCYLPDSTDASLKFGGVVPVVQQSTITQKGEYPANEMVSVCREGEIWVRVPDALTGCANKAAHVIDLTSDGDYKKFTDTAGANTYDNVAVFASNPISLGTGKTYARVVLDGLK